MRSYILRSAGIIFSRGVFVALTMLAGSSGCLTYAYHHTSGPNLQQTPIDRHAPRETLRWAFLWGLIGDVWTPYECAEAAPEGECAEPVLVCDHGPGRVEFEYSALSVLMTAVTLGIAVPAHLTVFCSTDRPPDVGP